jgi:hypothetical protein
VSLKLNGKYPLPLILDAPSGLLIAIAKTICLIKNKIRRIIETTLTGVRIESLGFFIYIYIPTPIKGTKK